MDEDDFFNTYHFKYIDEKKDEDDGVTLKMRCRFAVDKTKDKTFMSGEAG